MYIVFGETSPVRSDIYDDDKCYIDVGLIVGSISSDRGYWCLKFLRFDGLRKVIIE